MVAYDDLRVSSASENLVFDPLSLKMKKVRAWVKGLNERGWLLRSSEERRSVSDKLISMRSAERACLGRISWFMSPQAMPLTLRVTPGMDKWWGKEGANNIVKECWAGEGWGGGRTERKRLEPGSSIDRKRRGEFLMQQESYFIHDTRLLCRPLVIMSLWGVIEAVL